MPAVDRNFAIFALRELSMARTTDRLVTATERLAQELSGADAFVYRYDAENLVLIRGLADASIESVPLSDETAAGRCALTGLAQFATHEEGDGVTLYTAAFPLQRYGTLVGVLTVDRAPAAFHGDLVDTMEELCQVAAHLLDLVAGLEDADEYVSRSRDLMVRAVEAVSPGLQGHVMRLTRVVAELATWLDLSTRSRQLLWQASQYHDLGRIILAGDDAAEVRDFHARAAAEFLRSCRTLRPVAAIVEGHHECYADLEASPDRSPDEVPLESWVLAAAEDIEEFYLSRNGQNKEGWEEEFLADRLSVHHPAVADALRSLSRTGRLKAIYQAAAPRPVPA